MSREEDNLEIQMLAQRYADAVMRHDAEDWGACWAEDGEWHMGGPEPVKGRDAIVETWKGAMAGFTFAVFMVQPSIVEVDGDTGTSRSYVEEVLDASGNSFKVYGVYNDEVVREDGKWKFKTRRYSVLYNGPVDLSGQVTGYRG
jgi:uncharacterized protein (TIGR02246 family)